MIIGSIAFVVGFVMMICGTRKIIKQYGKENAKLLITGEIVACIGIALIVLMIALTVWFFDAIAGLGEMGSIEQLLFNI